jgi:hypothetical protein
LGELTDTNSGWKTDVFWPSMTVNGSGGVLTQVKKMEPGELQEAGAINTFFSYLSMGVLVNIDQNTSILGR